jgi:heptaprenyl diphosphate synthase
VNILASLALPSLEADLQRFEPLLAESVVVGDDFLDQITTHLIKAGGKRLRPVLAIASATKGTNEATQDNLLGAVSLELMHLASLYHDDVMDEAVIRRNVDTVNARFGNLVAIVAGDYLMARSAAIAADLGTEIAGLLARTLAQLTQGQVSEVQRAFDVNRSREDYYTAISGKTAALMASSCRVGGLTSSASAAEVDALTRYGHELGIIFQLRDDIMDVTAVDGELGKPAGQDLAEGIYTLPTLVALEDPTIGPELADLLGRALDEPEREKARSLVATSSGIDESLDTARSHVARARAAAHELPDEHLAQGFASLAELLLVGLPE